MSKSRSQRVVASFVGISMALLALTTTGCAGEDEAPPAAAEYAAGGAPPEFEVGPCEEATQQSCSVTIYQANGQKSCFTGVQFCVDGEWGDCLEQ